MNNQFLPEVNERVNREAHERMLKEAGNVRAIRSIRSNAPLVRNEKRISIRLVRAEKDEADEKEEEASEAFASPRHGRRLLGLLDAT